MFRQLNMARLSCQEDVMATDTFLLIRAIWSNPSTRNQLLLGFFEQVSTGASREDIDAWLYALIDSVPGQRRILRLQSIDLEAVHWKRITEFLCSCFYAVDRVRSPLPNLPGNSAWDQPSEAPVSELLAVHPQREKAIRYTVPLPFLPLEQKLLSYGGRRMVYVGEPDLEKILCRGEVFEGPSVLIHGEPNQCHKNAACLWNSGRLFYALATGYALFDDGLWRAHSWVVRKRPTAKQRRVIETTVRQVKYFGFVLTEAEAEVFYQENG